ncbi:AMP-binding protein [Dermatobacter hominis]|uniref:AMP-binding protein n=1 Tax=Dermatobacter hominis TaxID=2884263 RepID=UPI001D101739|nr:AMP-binding protein [Dermatobacter hominis]UDY36975.1 AMP-binding protein [Dermatobacter hominis]
MLLHEVIEFAAGAAGDVDALVFGDRRWTFVELERDVARMGTTLAHEVGRDERIAWFSDNRPELVMALYAVPRAGALLVLGNIRHTAAEQAAMLRSSSASVVVGSAEQLARLAPHADELHAVRRWYCLDGVGADGPSALPDGTRDAAELFDLDPEPPRSGLDDDTHVWLIHTSGTTGRAKGALLTHRSIVAASTNTALARPITDDDVYLFPFPLFHVAAYNVVVHHLGRRPVVLLPRFEAADVVTAIRDERVTTVSLAPTMLAMLLDHVGDDLSDLASLRRIGYGASAMPLDLLRRTLSDLPEVGLAQGYGMTELSGNAVFLGPDEHRRAAADEPWLLSAAGRPAPLVQIRIADDRGDDVAPGEPGEVLVRGDQVCAGYWDDPGATVESHHGAWFRTGDIGRVDEAGYLYVVDRKKDIIISGGENVSSREVEDIVSEHPEVSAVAVVGLPDVTWGERVCAVVVWDRSDGAAGDVEGRARALVDWTDGRMAGFKRPRVVVSVPALPTNASGKVDKRVIREYLGAGDVPDATAPA